MPDATIHRNDEFVSRDRFQPRVPSKLTVFRRLNDGDIMPFGPHKGKTLREVPASYWDYLRDAAWLETDRPALFEYLQRNAKAIDLELEESERSRERRY